jgi:hypothetical protein
MIRALLILLPVLLAMPAFGAGGITRLTVDPVAGAAPPFDKAIADKLSAELEQMGYEVAGAAPMRLSGRAIAISGPDGAKFQVAWTLKEASGRLLGQFTTAATAPYKVANPWDALDADTLKHLARSTAEAVEKTLEDTEAGSAAVLNAGQPKPDKPPREAQAPGAAPRMTKVFITGVTGAPGDGNTALPNALAIYFGQFDIELLSAKAPDAYIIEGRVSEKPKNAAQETVQILWLLKSPKGKELARIVQENAVPVGRLAPRWGKTADYAAEGAADGLLSTMAGFGVTPPAQ